MIDSQGALRNKERILSIVRMRGPSLPVQISRELGISTIFASAFLSELKAEGKIAISNMKVGSSPLYYIPGQEEQLERFTEYLNQREKEALALLKKNKILEDGKQEPVVRVALRALKDFAQEVQVNMDGEKKTIWKYFRVDDEDFSRTVNEQVLGVRELPKVSVASNASETFAAEENVIKNPVENIEKQQVLIKEIKKKNKKREASEFGLKVRDYLTVKDIEVKEVFFEKKKELEGIVRLDTLFGKQEFYVVAKDKKSVSDNDLTVALQKAQARKMPALFVASAEPSKRAKEYLQEWKNLVKFEFVKI